MSTPNNPPAFPRPQFNPQGVGYEDAGLGNDAQEGMTLRDYLIAHAIIGLLSESGCEIAKEVADHDKITLEEAVVKWAAKIADCALEERSKTK